MSVLNSVKECMALQDSFNAVVNPDWKKAGYSWRRAMWIESAELVDHLGYKWWKNVDQKPDRQQILLEIVDIFHFIISESMVERKTADNILSSYEWAKRHTYAPNKEKQIKQVEEFVMLCLESNQNILTSFFQIVVALKFEIEDVLRWYLGKNALNKLRQDHGYKDGTYRKQWTFDGELVEDNKVLEYVLRDSPDLGFQDIYAKLDAYYQSMLQ